MIFNIKPHILVENYGQKNKKKKDSSMLNVLRGRRKCGKFAVFSLPSRKFSTCLGQALVLKYLLPSPQAALMLPSCTENFLLRASIERYTRAKHDQILNFTLRSLFRFSSVLFFSLSISIKPHFDKTCPRWINIQKNPWKPLLK